MINYIFILFAAITIFSILFILVGRGRVIKAFLWIPIYGFSIAIIGIFLQQNFSLYYAILAMAGLVFAISILLDKRLERERPTEESLSGEPRDPVVVLPTEPFQVEEEAAATTEEHPDDEFTLTPLEDDLDRWMKAEQKDVSGGAERKEGRDEQ